MGIEPMTSSLPRKRSTPELHRLIQCFWYIATTTSLGPFSCQRLVFQPKNVSSGRPGSNRRHSAWKADALPTELLPQLSQNTMGTSSICQIIPPYLYRKMRAKIVKNECFTKNPMRIFEIKPSSFLSWSLTYVSKIKKHIIFDH